MIVGTLVHYAWSYILFVFLCGYFEFTVFLRCASCIKQLRSVLVTPQCKMENYYRKLIAVEMI